MGARNRTLPNADVRRRSVMLAQQAEQEAGYKLKEDAKAAAVAGGGAATETTESAEASTVGEAVKKEEAPAPAAAAEKEEEKEKKAPGPSAPVLAPAPAATGSAPAGDPSLAAGSGLQAGKQTALNFNAEEKPLSTFMLVGRGKGEAGRQVEGSANPPSPTPALSPLG